MYLYIFIFIHYWEIEMNFKNISEMRSVDVLREGEWRLQYMQCNIVHKWLIFEFFFLMYVFCFCFVFFKSKRNTENGTVAYIRHNYTMFITVDVAVERISYRCDKRKENLSSLTMYEMGLVVSAIAKKVAAASKKENANQK